jgi:hypothetical protein
MANHIRQQLREALATRLTGLATTGANVSGYRVHPLQVSALPALVINALQEAAEPEGIHAPVTVQREPQFVIQAVARANADLDDTLDAIAKEVETALGTALTIGSKDFLMLYRGCKFEFEYAEKPIGTLDMIFDVKIFNVATTPDVFD